MQIKHLASAVATRLFNANPDVRAPSAHPRIRRSASAALLLVFAACAALPAGAQATETAQCTTVLTNLRLPAGTVLTDYGDLLVAESGDGTRDSGRISIVDRRGQRRTLIDGMPSARADVGSPSGPAGLFLQGGALYVAIGTGDVGIMGPRPGTSLRNPDGPSSPIFSSVLALYFSPATAQRTSGFSMTPADQQALAKGRMVWLRDRRNNLMAVRMVTNFPNYVPTPLPDVPDNISLSNPYGIAGVDGSLFVTDGGRNLLWRLDSMTGAASVWVTFPDVPNPLFGHVGGPLVQAVPTGITAVDRQLLVSLFRGAPFPTGVSSVEMIDPATATHSTYLANLTTAIDALPIRRNRHRDLLVIENSSAGPFFAGPGTLLRFNDMTGTPTTLADCLVSPTSMVFNQWNHTLYVTEEGGNLVTIPMR